ncbi:MAG TPA: hypothetical protein VGH02_04740 [Rhizomicrobium sp.]|jgi:hypothetical protein
MDAAYDWLNFVTAIFLGKAGGIAGVLAIIGALVAVGAAIFQSEGAARTVGIILVAISLAFGVWVIARPNHYRVSGQYGFAIDVPASLAVVDWEADRVTLAGGDGGNRANLRTGEVPHGQSPIAFMMARQERALKFVQDRKGELRMNAAGPGYVFTRWTEPGSPDDPDSIDHFSGTVLRQDDGVGFRWASVRATMSVHNNPLRARDYARIRQTLCASARLPPVCVLAH